MSSLDPAAVVDAPSPLLPVPPDQPNFGQRLRRSIVDHNPFFLLSALCMLAGSLAVTNSLSWSPVRLERVLLLAVTINVYELLLVGLGVTLLRRPLARRDGSILLIVEAFFLVDVAFLNAELFAINPQVGLIANVLLFTLAVAKIAFIARAIGVEMADPRLLLAVLQIFAIYAMPGVLKFYATANGGTLPALAMLIVWWSIFAIGVGAHSLLTHVPNRLAPGAVGRWFVPLLTILGGVSLLAHAGTSQWIYDLRYWGADLAPMLALAAFILCSRKATRTPGVLCAIAATFASASYGPHLRMSLLGNPLTPVHITCAVVYAVLAWTLARRAFPALIGAGAAVILATLFGPPIATMRQGLAWIVGRADQAIEIVRPKTLAHWGVVSITMSFALLALGAMLSLRRDQSPPLAERAP
jgi:hypothetical protein